MDFLKVLRAYLAKAYKMSDGDIDAILEASKDDQDALMAALLEKDKQRVADLKKPTQGQTFQDGYKKAKAEVLTEFENSIKEKYGIDSDANGVELVEALVTEKTKGAKPKDLTEDDVKKHPAYQSAEKAFKAQLKQTQTEWEQKLTDTTNQFKKQEVFGSVRDKALGILQGMNPALPTNPKVAATIQNTFLDSLKSYEFDIQDNGARVVVMKDGKVVDDGHGHSLDFEKLVKDQAGNFFEFKANNGGGNAGNGAPNSGGAAGAQGAGGKAYPAGITKPTNWEELNKVVNDQSIKAEDRQVVLDTFVAENPGK
jgi:hypothetical protein